MSETNESCLGTTRCKCAICTQKRKEWNREYGQRKKSEIRENKRRYRVDNTDVIANYQKKWRADHVEHRASHQKDYRAKHLPEIKAKKKVYREANEDHINKKIKIYYQENTETRKQYAKDYRKDKMHPDKRIYEGMKYRCDNPTDTNYSKYGGRGITVCDRWRGDDGFSNFIADMGPRPAPRYKYSIDRIDVDGNYEPSNCRWATQLEQANNKRNNISYKLGIPDDTTVWYLGIEVSLIDLSSVTGIDLKVVKYRYVDAGRQLLKNTVDNSEVASYVVNPFEPGRQYIYKLKPYTRAELCLLSGKTSNEIAVILNSKKYSIDELIDKK